jgi:hypothetical protein
MDLTTYTQQLTSLLQDTLSSFNTPEFLSTKNELLSSLALNNTLSAINSIVRELTSVPVHPYDILLCKHFDLDHKFKTIDDIPDPGTIPLEECIQFLKEKGKEINKTTFHNLTCQPEEQLTSVYQTLSNDKIICDIEKEKNYLEFFEMMRQIPIDSITEENCDVIGNKILAEYLRVS